MLFFLIGLIAFFLLYLSFSLLQPSLFKQTHSIGIVGSYTKESIPSEILNKISYGLTDVSGSGRPLPKAASRWTIKDDGRTYIFKIKEGQKFSDGTKLTSYEINYNFENVKIERPSQDTIIFKLNNSYSPFLITVSRPVFRKEFLGLGEYKVKNTAVSGEFFDSITLHSTKSNQSVIYKFYPTEKALKLALIMGEVDKSNDISDLSIMEENFTKFRNLKINKFINYDKLVTIFYNTQNKHLSDKRLREALNYALPNEFSQGKRNYTPYPPSLWASQEQTLAEIQDIDHAKDLLKISNASSSSTLSFKLKTLPKYKDTAIEIRKSWVPLGIKVDIEPVNTLPSDFDMFLGEFMVSKDPDQYSIWHSSQENNISRYRNLRIDKLLEDGRQITDTSQRRKIYADFQKYLLDDPPAGFLYFPYYYTVSK